VEGTYTVTAEFADGTYSVEVDIDPAASIEPPTVTEALRTD
jgi:hypothetical protein